MVHAEREVASDKATQGGGAALRPETPEDGPFLAELFAVNARALYGAAAAVLEPMIAIQHRAQSQTYATDYPRARGEIILDPEGLPAGRLLTNTADNGVLVVDIAVLPHRRKMGLARMAVEQVMGRARQAGLPVLADVFITNAASLALFSGLGFAAAYQEGQAQAHLRWTP